MAVWAAAAVVLLVNLPFGYWRGNVRPLTPQWALAIHIPVVLAMAIRFLAGVPLDPTSLLVMVAAFFLGQFAGLRTRAALASLLPVPLTSCIFIDLFRALMS